ncbi:MAG: hypothetical protein CMJ81_13795 [Planctomycetaceae bacterium]|nr:hypothetical protein [Planctomycetaceae bacterium]
MKLTLQTNFALRTMIYAAFKQERIKIAEVAQFFDISKAHVAKVVNPLTRHGYMSSIRGPHETYNALSYLFGEEFAQSGPTVTLIPPGKIRLRNARICGVGIRILTSFATTALLRVERFLRKHSTR